MTPQGPQIPVAFVPLFARDRVPAAAVSSARQQVLEKPGHVGFGVTRSWFRAPAGSLLPAGAGGPAVPRSRVAARLPRRRVQVAAAGTRTGRARGVPNQGWAYTRAYAPIPHII